MQILTADQVRAWDEFTIQHEPVASIDLMERAAQACFDWIMNAAYSNKKFSIFCGKGNNGGDGLAVARMLAQKDYSVQVYLLESRNPGTFDFQVNLQRLHHTTAKLQFISNEAEIPGIHDDVLVIDALFGTGINRPLEGLAARLVEQINASGKQVISIDIPSGLSADSSSKGKVAICATHTLSFQCLKPAFIVAENERMVGRLHLLNIGLHPGFLNTLQSKYEWVTATCARKIFRPRKAFAHKGNFGHALLVAGSYGKMGAAVLSAKAILCSGAGLLTVHVPKCGYSIMQICIPEAMTVTDEVESEITHIQDGFEKYKGIGIGPGIGTSAVTRGAIEQIFEEFDGPIVLDADALNLISNDAQLLSRIPPQSILTPHPKEFERLFGMAENDFDRMNMAAEQAVKRNIIIVLKGHHTCIATPSGLYINSTGNVGMAKGGTGDVLTGIVTALVCQGYPPAEAAILGVYLHGKAADIAAVATGYESMLASVIIGHIGKTFQTLYT